MRTSSLLPASILTLVGLAAAAPAVADTRTYPNPVVDGYRLSFCDLGSAQCGGPVADQWCRSRGFERAHEWSIAEHVGELVPTITLTGRRICKGTDCNGFAAITCERAERTFRMPSLGSMGRSTVLSPDRRSTERVVTQVEYRLLVPGCHQRAAGVLMCETLHDYQHCRTLLAEGVVLGCRAGLAFDGGIAEPYAAPPGSFDLDLHSSASATVYRGRRGEGKLKGEVRYRIAFAAPATADACLQRDRYIYYPTGPQGGVSDIGETAACDKPIGGRFAPHVDDLLHAYDLCEAGQAWGERLDSSTELLVAALYYLEPEAPNTATRVVAPYTTVSGALKVSCRL